MKMKKGFHLLILTTLLTGSFTSKQSKAAIGIAGGIAPSAVVLSYIIKATMAAGGTYLAYGHTTTIVKTLREGASLKSNLRSFFTVLWGVVMLDEDTSSIEYKEISDKAQIAITKFSNITDEDIAIYNSEYDILNAIVSASLTESYIDGKMDNKKLEKSLSENCEDMISPETAKVVSLLNQLASEA